MGAARYRHQNYNQRWKRKLRRRTEKEEYRQEHPQRERSASASSASSSCIRQGRFSLSRMNTTTLPDNDEATETLLRASSSNFTLDESITSMSSSTVSFHQQIEIHFYQKPMEHHCPNDDWLEWFS